MMGLTDPSEIKTESDDPLELKMKHQTDSESAISMIPNPLEVYTNQSRHLRFLSIPKLELDPLETKPISTSIQIQPKSTPQSISTIDFIQIESSDEEPEQEESDPLILLPSETEKVNMVNVSQSHLQSNQNPTTIKSKGKSTNLSSSSTKSQVSYHLEKNFWCSKCLRSFSSKSNLITHQQNPCGGSYSRYSAKLNKHLTLPVPSYNCEKCPEKFQKESSLKLHLLTHDDTAIPVEVKAKAKTKTNIKGPNKKGKNGSKAKTEITQTFEVDPLKLDNSTVPSYTVTFECRASNCNQVFYSPFSLDQHEKCHIKDKKIHWNCIQCRSPFGSKNELHKHLVRHSNVTPFKCTKCSLYFSRRNRLTKHLASHSINEKVELENYLEDSGSESDDGIMEIQEQDPLQDPFQDYSIPIVPPVQVVEADSEGESEVESYDPNKNQSKLYKCDICLKPYDEKNKSKLSLHIRKRDRGAPIKCMKCPRLFCTYWYLRKHVREDHSGKLYKLHKCPHPGCSKTYVKLWHFRIHQANQHGGDKPYECPARQCQKSFAAKCHLDLHIRRVHNHKVYECILCNTSYRYALGLQTHMEEYHPDQSQIKIESNNKQDSEQEQQSVPIELLNDPLNVPVIAISNSHSPLSLNSENFERPQDYTLGSGSETQTPGQDIIVKIEDVKVIPDVNLFL